MSGIAPRAGGADPRSAEDWWAVRPIAAPEVPGGAAGGGGHPIDAFLAEARRRAGLAAAPAADPRTLIRRVTFDLTGLPPAPDEIDAFLADAAADPEGAWGRLVDRLLASPRYGERWARRWLDVVHFAETHGHDQDRVREHAWPYRDYVIRSFNADKPYDRFVREQVAGDALAPGDPDGIVALGFLGAGPWDESSLRDIREDTLDRQIARYVDRDDIVTTVMQTFTSVTVQCARCHDHKFDPVSLDDYYALQAVFAGTDKGNRRFDPDPEVFRRRRELTARLAEVRSGADDLASDPAVRERVRDWEDRRREALDAWTILRPEVFVSDRGTVLTRLEDDSILSGGEQAPDADVVTVTGALPPGRLSALRLELLTDPSLPMNGPGRAANGNLHLSRIEVNLFTPDDPRAVPLPIAGAVADFDQDGWTIAHAIDSDDQTAWGIHPQEGRAHSAVFLLGGEEPSSIPEGSRLAITLHQVHGRGHVVGRFRLAVSASPEPTLLAPVPAEIEEILATPRGERTPEHDRVLAAHVEAEAIGRELGRLPEEKLVYVAAGEFEPDASHRPAGSPREIHVLNRGDVQQPLKPAVPGALACVDALEARFEASVDGRIGDEAARRAALADWLADPANPLTWRSIVNRIWHFRFGRGLVDTPNDFGLMGASPTHPELLDWLAVWFRDEAGGSIKALDRLIVTSGAYRLASRTEPAILESDPENRRYTRMPRRRLDAECVRDAVLAVSGRLDPRMGGPSDRQFDLQPGIHVTPKVDYAAFDPDEPEGRRRSIYRFLFRTLPDPWMEALDCPAGDQLVAARTNSVTPQQALALWNSRFTAAHSAHFAERIETRAAAEGWTPDQAVDHAVITAWGRPPSPAERDALVRHVADHGWVSASRVLFNASEFLFLD